ncbi:MAG: AMP-binding protein, partial [Pseudomonadota bacterium]
MADGQVLPPFRPLPMKGPDIEVTRTGEGVVYLTPRQAPGDRPRTIPHCLDERAGEHPDRVFLKERGPDGDWVSMTYGEAKAATDALSQAFLDMGAGPDAPVMILSGNSIASAMVILAAQKIGAPAAPISVAYSLMSTDFEKLKHCFHAVKPKVIFTEMLEPFQPALAALDTSNVTIITRIGAGEDIQDYSA